MITFEKLSTSNYICTLDLNKLYDDQQSLKKFNENWEEFFKSDETNQYVLERKANLIMYPHKSWIPKKKDGRIPVLIFAGNPAPHSVWKDVYYAYEGKGVEHRFWKVLRELKYLNLIGSDPEIKSKFLNGDYDSQFMFGFEAMFTFPSTASKPKWSGVMGLEKLFGRRAFLKMYEVEKNRVKDTINEFLGNSGAIIAMQKDAYNSIAENKYDIKLAVENKLSSKIGNIKIYGTPPTRWLHTKKMKKVLSDIRDELLNKA